MPAMLEEANGKSGQPTGGRKNPERPRDELGRPQPWGSENRLHLEDFDHLPIEENHRLAREHFNAGRFFHAATSRIGRYPQSHLGVDTAAVVASASREADAIGRGDLVPGPKARHSVPTV